MTILQGTPTSTSLKNIGRVQVFNCNILEGIKVKFVYTAPGETTWQKSKVSQVGPRTKRLLLSSELGVPHDSTVQLVCKGDFETSKKSIFKGESLAVTNYVYRRGELNLKEKKLVSNLTVQLVGRSYLTPRKRNDLKNIVQSAVANGVKLRVSGQRHSQTPLVVDNQTPSTWLIDMSSYVDLGNGTKQIILSENGNTVTVNTGVQVEELEFFCYATTKCCRLWR